MFNLLLALRHFWKNRLTSIINVLGLSIGISTSLVIYTMVDYESGFDKKIEQGERVYRIVTDGNFKNWGVRAPLPGEIKSNIPGIEMLAHYLHDRAEPTITIPAQQKIFKKQQGVIFTDPDYFKIVPHRWLAGSAENALNSPKSVVLTKERMQQLFPGFGVENVIGETITIRDSIQLAVSGVVEARSDQNSFQKHAIFISMATVQAESSLRDNFRLDNWSSLNDFSQCFVRLHDNTSAASIADQINQVYKNAMGNIELNDYHRLQPLNAIHYDLEFSALGVRSIDKTFIRNLTLLAVFMLLLAAINFINLSTAQSGRRAIEIDIQKTLGVTKAQLIRKFLLESFVTTFTAAILALLISPMLFKLLADYATPSLELEELYNYRSLLFLLILIPSLALFAGFYPALVLSGFKPASIIKNQLSPSAQTRAGWLRKGLIVFQFVIAQIFLISILVIGKQMDYSRNKDMGFRKNAIVNFYIPNFNRDSSNRRLVLRDELRRIQEVESASLGNQSPAFSGSIKTSVFFMKGEEQISASVSLRDGDSSFIHVYQIPLLAGRNIRPNDSLSEYLINESMLKLMGITNPSDAIGKNLNNSEKIVGVMKDFNTASTRERIEPLMFRNNFDEGYVMHVALAGSNLPTWSAAIQKMEATWKTVYPEADFEYTFLDETIERFYAQDQRLSKLLTWATGLAIFIAGMGLVGLGIFTANQRTKEISIRKVLGARVMQIIMLLTGNLLILVLLACLIAFPIAGYFMHEWLAGFAYRIELSWWLFAISALAMTTLAAGILAFKAFRTASSNPVKYLRDE